MWEVYVLTDGNIEMYFQNSPIPLLALIGAPRKEIVNSEVHYSLKGDSSIFDMAAERAWPQEIIGAAANTRPEWVTHRIICPTKEDATLIKMFFDVEPSKIP